MKNINNYKDFILENEFKSILKDLILLTELNTGDTLEWDYTPKKDIKAPEVEWEIENDLKTIKDIKAHEVEWDVNIKKSFKDYVNDVKTNINKFTQYLNDGDEDVDISFKISNDKISKFLSKLKDKEEIKKYFYRIVNELLSLPNKVKIKILVSATLIFLSAISLSELIPNDKENEYPVLKEVKLAVNNNVEKMNTYIDKIPQVNKEFKKSKFEIAQEHVAISEGGYTEDPNDDGNWTRGEEGKGSLIGTNFGISAPALVDYYKNKGIDRTPSKSDMKNLTYETALDIYKNDYWDQQQLQNITNQSIANVLYDACVNQGNYACFDIFKETLEEFFEKDYNVKSWDDLHKTDAIYKLNSLNHKDSKEFFDLLKNNRLEEYKMAKRWDRYKKSWSNRLDRLNFRPNDQNNA